MVVIGLCGGHDANWCIFKDGYLVGAFEKERFTRIRHDAGEIMELVDRSLLKHGISFDEVNIIATSEANFKGTDPGLCYINKSLYKEPDEWTEMIVDFHGRKIPCFAVPHHLCHASYAFYTSNSSDGTVITLDGGGDFYTENAYTSSSISTWKEGKLNYFERIGNSDLGSLWHIYSQVLFQNQFAAGKIMGLAGYGSDRLVDEISAYCLRPVRGTLCPTMSVKNCWPDEDMPLFNYVNNWKLNDAFDLAYAIQNVTLRAGTGIVKAAYELYPSKTLSLSGGVALNGYMNTAIAKMNLFKEVHVPPSVHDGGLSIGAAMFTINHILGLKSLKVTNNDLVFNGFDYSDTCCTDALEKAQLKYSVCESEEIIQQIAHHICDGKIVAWYEGKSEHGPRALGHRSFLADPRFADMKDRLNNTIKFREDFRPIAPVVLEADMKRCTQDINKSPFMMNIVKTTNQFMNDNPSGTHVDGTARVQSVNMDNSMGEIIQVMKETTGGYALLNTSFNSREPLVETPYQAVATFSKVPVDVLVLNKKFIVRR